ncbi:MAG: malto-oligosyltrehalose trehalohydrolase [Steroidobacteraceae bacterium]|nr:malto-oligosyltrehalose trehalohydrolase [Steroidobacteraceae bacterium]
MAAGAGAGHGARSRRPVAFGASLAADGAHFRLFAPAQAQVALQVEGEASARPMYRDDDGWHALDCDDLGAGTRYRYRLGDGSLVPDPASRFQPEDVHGPSELVDPLAHRWQDGAWRGRPWHEAVVYELHVGSFTPEGTFRAVIGRLEHLAALGVTAIELMPVAEFPGRRNWGYDGVLPFAPDSRYGRPEDLKALVDAAHQRGLMILLDVVYNHFGPDGNYTHLYWPQLMTQRHQTPWGAAVNYDDAGCTQVREFVIANALHWLGEYHFDGLRLDAVHAIRDAGPRHLLDELAARAAALRPGHAPPHLVLENEENETRWLPPAGGCTAQWNDDVHHGLHVALTGECSGYYAEYQEDPGKLPRALAEGFAFQGETMRYRGHPRGTPSAHLHPTAFVSFLQNHDQVGNRARGERIARLAPQPAVRAAAATYLLAPQVPMLFMGEEWGSRQPFLYFCDFDEPLATAVRDGRRAEFARFPEFAGSAALAIPDPTDAASFAASVLDWSAAEAEAGRDWLQWYRAVLAVRHSQVVPLLAPRPGGAPQRPARWSAAGQAFQVTWWLQDRELSLIANLAPAASAAPAVRTWLAAVRGRATLWREGWGAADGVAGTVALEVARVAPAARDDPATPVPTTHERLPAWSVWWTIG